MTPEEKYATATAIIYVCAETMAQVIKDLDNENIRPKAVVDLLPAMSIHASKAYDVGTTDFFESPDIAGDLAEQVYQWLEGDE